MPSLSIPLMYPLISPCLSLTRMEAHGMGLSFLFFSNCGYKIKRLLGFIPMFFLFFDATISLHSIGMRQLNRC